MIFGFFVLPFFKSFYWVIALYVLHFWFDDDMQLYSKTQQIHVLLGFHSALGYINETNIKLHQQAQIKPQLLLFPSGAPSISISWIHHITLVVLCWFSELVYTVWLITWDSSCKRNCTSSLHLFHVWWFSILILITFSQLVFVNLYVLIADHLQWYQICLCTLWLSVWFVSLLSKLLVMHNEYEECLFFNWEYQWIVVFWCGLC